MIEAPPRHRRAAQTLDLAGPSTYYCYPALKPIDWGWQVILYFFTGGIAAGSYVVATLVDIFGPPEDRPVARAGRYIALGAVAISPLLLIADLGRKERFANMLRILKSRSPMSAGTWGLGAFSLFVGLGSLRQATEDNLIRRDSPIARFLAWVPLSTSGLLGSLFSFFVGSYTGVLLAFTNVPVWAKNHLLLGPLFLTSALSSGLAAISLALAASKSDVAPRTRTWLSQAETAASLGEMGILAGSLATLGSLSRPFLRKPYALPFWLGSVGLGIIMPLALRRSEAGPTSDLRSARNVAAATAVLLGSLILRGVIVMVGRESVRDPAAYLTFTRDGRRKGPL